MGWNFVAITAFQEIPPILLEMHGVRNASSGCTVQLSACHSKDQNEERAPCGKTIRGIHSFSILKKALGAFTRVLGNGNVKLVVPPCESIPTAAS